MSTLKEATVDQLEPGDVVELHFPVGPAVTAIHVATLAPHPIWPALSLVIWRLSDGTWSHDALDPRQVLPGVVQRPQSFTQRRSNLSAALLENEPGR